MPKGASMQVNRPSNIPGPLSTDRSNRDGHRRQGEGKGKEQGKQPQEQDAVELHAPKDGKAPVLKPLTAPKAGQGNSGKQPPLDLSA